MERKTDDVEIGKWRRWEWTVCVLLWRGQWAVIFKERRLGRVLVPRGHAWQREGYADIWWLFVEKTIRK